jgi:hypothetical protein
MWALDLGVSVVCVFESPLKGIPPLGFQPPVFLSSFRGKLGVREKENSRVVYI